MNLYLKNPDQRLPDLAKAASTFAKIKKSHEALKYFSAYFSKGGSDPEAGYQYALLLSKHEMFSQARQYFQFSIAAHDAKRLPRITRSYISMLMKWNKWNMARREILEFRRSNSTAHYFMENELQKIDQRLGRNRIPARSQRKTL